jgi:ArsR family metal-binding transcriptional regulator
MITTMASVKVRRDSVRDVDAGESEAEELERLAQETREKGVSWKSLKAELGL